MKRIVFALIIAGLFCISISAESYTDALCSQQAALGQTALGRSNNAALMFANPALLKFVPGTSVALDYCRQYNMSELDLVNLAVSHNFGRVHSGFAYVNFGDPDIMTDNGFYFAASVGILKYISIGMDWTWRRLSFAGDFEDLTGNLIGLGMAFDFRDIIFHASIATNGSLRFSEDDDDENKPGYRIGVSLMNISYLVLNLEVSGIDGQTRYHFGQEIMLEDKFFVRLGVITNPTIPSLGLGYRWSRFQLDYALSRHSDLGDTQSFGFTLAF